MLQQILAADNLDEQLGVITAEKFLKALRGILTKGVDFSELVVSSSGPIDSIS